MQRMKAEHDKTIQEAARIRDEYAISDRMAHETYDQIIQKVEGQQSSRVFGLQVDCLKKRANNLERELTEVMEKHEREMKAKENRCSVYKENLEREIRKNKSLQEGIRDYEELVLQGSIPPVEKGGKSPSSIEEAPKSKRIKVEGEKELKIISVEVDVLRRIR